MIGFVASKQTPKFTFEPERPDP